ncbi:MAG TPA: DNA cytosine methyltransferase [Bryobacteraceae bacterium]|nr:DNA cytosine methyltransferase [Bryobacteraceae bacterium]
MEINQVKKYSDTEQRTDDLFFEYARILRGVRASSSRRTFPDSFAEPRRDTFSTFSALKASGYRVACRALDAQWLGVPQARVRLIFVGVREDLDARPAFPKPLCTLRENNRGAACGD